MKKFLLLASVLCTGCAFKFGEIREPIEQPMPLKTAVSKHLDARELNEKEKTAFILSAIGHSLDLASNLSNGEQCEEQNFILGKNPNVASLVGLKIVALTFEYWLYTNPNIHGDTHYFGYTSAIIHAGYGISNWIECP